MFDVKRREQKRGREENCQKTAGSGSRATAEPKAVEACRAGSFDAKSGSFDNKSGSCDAKSGSFEGQTTSTVRAESSSSRVPEAGTGAKIIKAETSPAKDIGETQGSFFWWDLVLIE